MIVVDASLAAKWILWEDDSDRALQFLKSYQVDLRAPDLILSEVAGAITRIARMADIGSEDADELLGLWLGDFGSSALDLRRSSRDLIAQAARLSIDLAHPIQDCLYLAMAIDLEAELATCDARFRDKAVGAHPRIKLLAHYA
jgi:predicted nucleic acid-binding protein